MISRGVAFRHIQQSILLLRPQDCRWRKWASYLRLAGRCLGVVNTRYDVSQPVASRRLNAGWLSCCGRCDVNGVHGLYTALPHMNLWPLTPRRG